MTIYWVGHLFSGSSIVLYYHVIREDSRVYKNYKILFGLI